jgi:uncharacterized OB-fold protein
MTSQVELRVSIDEKFQGYLDQGRFMIQRARVSLRAFYYPRVAEPLTGSTDLEWFEASGSGVVYATTVVRARPPADSYNVALIDLVEGPRVTSKVVGLAPADVKIGMRVRARIDQVDGRALLVFEPEGAAV